VSKDEDKESLNTIYSLLLNVEAAGFGDDDEEDDGIEEGDGHDGMNLRSVVRGMMRFHLVLSMFDEMEETVDEHHPEISQLPRLIVLPGILAFQIGARRGMTNEIVNENSRSSDVGEERMEMERLHPPTPISISRSLRESISEAEVRPHPRYRRVGLPPHPRHDESLGRDESRMDNREPIEDDSTAEEKTEEKRHQMREPRKYWRSFSTDDILEGSDDKHREVKRRKD
jgi:hypothetical protein